MSFSGGVYEIRCVMNVILRLIACNMKNNKWWNMSVYIWKNRGYIFLFYKKGLKVLLIFYYFVASLCEIFGIK